MYTAERLYYNWRFTRLLDKEAVMDDVDCIVIGCITAGKQRDCYTEIAPD